MSSSETGGKFYSGRVILGMDTPGPDVMTIQEMEGKKPPTWDEDSCSLLLERVRTKARDAAAEILGEARREAQALKEQARQEGLADGFAQAQSEVERQMREFGLTLGNILEAIQSQEVRVFEAQRQDFARLIRLAVQKAVGVEMAERRKEVLETLLHEPWSAWRACARSPCAWPPRTWRAWSSSWPRPAPPSPAWSSGRPAATRPWPRAA